MSIPTRARHRLLRRSIAMCATRGEEKASKRAGPSRGKSKLARCSIDPCRGFVAQSRWCSGCSSVRPVRVRGRIVFLLVSTSRLFLSGRRLDRQRIARQHHGVHAYPSSIFLIRAVLADLIGRWARCCARAVADGRADPTSYVIPVDRPSACGRPSRRAAARVAISRDRGRALDDVVYGLPLLVCGTLKIADLALLFCSPYQAAGGAGALEFFRRATTRAFAVRRGGAPSLVAHLEHATIAPA